MVKRTRRGVAGIAAAVAAVLITGCTSGGSASPSPSTDASTPAGPGGSGTGGSATLTGAQLAKLLPPQAKLPAGWQETQDDRTLAANSGARLAAPVPEVGPIPSSYRACTNWGLQLNPDELTYVWRSSSADSVASDVTLPAPAQSVNLVLAGYRPGDASKQFAWDEAFARHCHSYRLSTNHSLITITATPESGLGDQSLYVQLLNPSTFAGHFLRTHIGVLIVRTGNIIVGLSQAGSSNVKGDPPMTLPQFETMSRWMLTQVAGQ